MKFIINEYIDKICNVNGERKCCKYLYGLEDHSLHCAKVIPDLKEAIDEKWKTEHHVAQGDNCDGMTNLKDAKLPHKI